jgi:amino acid adenylation domain-containing protein
MAPTAERPWWHLAGLAEHAFSAHGDRPFLRDPRLGVSLDYRTAGAMVGEIAAHLRRRGVARGDRVVVFSENRLEVPLLVLATAHLGGVFCVLSDGLRAETAAAIVRQAEPRAIVLGSATAHLAAVHDAAAAAGVEAIRVDDLVALAAEGRRGAGAALAADPAAGTPPASGDELVGLVYTSGSTGEPKGVMLSQDNVVFTALAIQRRLQYRPDDVVGLFLPLSFDYGLYQVFLAALSGAELVVGDARHVGPDFVRTLRRHRITVLPVVPTLASALLSLAARQAEAAPALRCVTSTGEHFPAAYLRRLQHLLPGVSVFLMYGLTECKRVSILLPEELVARPDSVGRPLDGVEVEVIDGDGLRVRPGEVGELAVRGRNVTLGYWRDPAETAKRFRRHDREGETMRELLTGDYGRVDADGYLYVVGRRDGLLKHRGYRISAAEIEATVAEVPGVSEAAVVRAPEADELHLFVTAESGDAPRDRILEVLRQRLEAFKVPEHVHSLDRLPRKPTGKIDRDRLRALLTAERAR